MKLVGRIASSDTVGAVYRDGEVYRIRIADSWSARSYGSIDMVLADLAECERLELYADAKTATAANVPLGREQADKFLGVLKDLTKECNDNVDKYFRERFENQSSADKTAMAQYWQNRRNTLLEVRQLWKETFGE